MYIIKSHVMQADEVSLKGEETQANLARSPRGENFDVESEGEVAPERVRPTRPDAACNEIGEIFFGPQADEERLPRKTEGVMEGAGCLSRSTYIQNDNEPFHGEICDSICEAPSLKLPPAARQPSEPDCVETASSRKRKAGPTSFTSVKRPRNSC